jgi:hypothetical protein
MIVNIKYVNFPKPGGKYGSLKTADGFTIMCPPDLLGLFRAGQVVEVPTKQQTWGQGTEDEKLVTIITGGPLQGHTTPVQGQGGPVGYQRPAQDQAPYRPNTGFQPRVVQGGGRADPAIDQSRHIFVTGVVGRAMGSGKFTASEIPVLTQAANEAYDRLERLLRGVPESRPAPPPAPEPFPFLEPGDPGPELQ